MSYPVVMIHGMWCTGANWARVAELLEPRGYRCHAPTLPAHGAVPDQPLQVRSKSLRDYADYLVDWVKAQDFDKPPIIIGHSMGGLLAQQVAMRSRPLALVLLTPAPQWGINALKLPTIIAFSRWLVSGALWRNAHKPSAERAALSAYNGVPEGRHRQIYEGLVHESGRAAFEIAFWWADASRAAAVHSDEVGCPVYVVGCGQDKLVPGSVVRKVAARYPQATQRYYADRGHWVIDDEETEEMMHLICSWLRPIEKRHEAANRGA